MGNKNMSSENMKCSKHPKYKAVRTPKTCDECWKVYYCVRGRAIRTYGPAYNLLSGFIFLLLFSTSGFAQTPSQTQEGFEPIENGFSVARAVQMDGTRALLVLFPDKYLENDKAIEVGIEAVMPLLFSCDPWPVDCKARISGHGVDKNKTRYAYMDVLVEKVPTRILIYGLTDTQQNNKVVGIAVMVQDKPLVIFQGENK